MPTNDALIASLLLGQRQKRDPLEIYQSFGRQMSQAGTSTAPLGSGNALEGIARALQGGLGGLVQGYAMNKQDEQDKATGDSFRQMALAKSPEEFAAASQGVRGMEGNAVLGQIAQARLDQLMAQQQAGAKLGPLMGGAMPGAPQAGPLQQGGGAAPPGGIPQPGYAAGTAPGRINAQAIAGIESGGQPNGGYGAVGPVANAQGNRAYGKYQVLDSNIGPWTQEILGRPMTPQEFLASPEAQDKVFEGKFGQYVTQYGSPQGASRAWFAGPNGMNNSGASDVNGVSVAQYEGKFNDSLQRAAGAPGVAQPPQGSGNVAINQGPPTAMSSPAGDQLRQRAQAAAQVGDNVTALKYAQEAAQEDSKWAAKIGEKNVDQVEEERRHQRGLQDKKDNPVYTQEQNLSHTYATRLNNAIPQLEALIADPKNIPSAIEMASANSSYFPEGMVSDKAKEYRRIVKDILSATLRRESGASIADSEYASETQKFIPQAGDPPNVIANKLAALKQAARSISEGTGRPVETYSFFGGAPKAGATAVPSAGGSGVPAPPPGFRPL